VERGVRHLNTKVYNTMQGPSEFVITGNFKDWDRWKDLPAIAVPTLLCVGRYDTMNPADVKKMSELIPTSRFALCTNGSHLSLYDDQERYMHDLMAFLNDVQKGRFGKSRPV
jgi:proline iminopeptidase